jgi:aminopeptidase N
MNIRILPGILALLLLHSCSLFKKQEQDYAFPEIDEAYLEDVPAGSETFKPSATRYWNLVHTRLELDVDIPGTRVSGTAMLRLSAFAKTRDSLVLDAKKMVIEGVYLNTNPPRPLVYRQNNDTTKCTVYFQEPVRTGDTVTLELRYRTLPKSDATKPWDAITSDQGIYFIDPHGEDPDVPTQVWTQGETESNSHWFPTLDAPNQKTTQWFSFRFPDTLVSLSNGSLVYSTKNGDGTRTDVWQQEQPHAPYLAMVAIGKWNITEDARSEELPVRYYTEPEYARYANMVFGNTPEMIDFFGKITGVEYPWEKFDQVVVRDFVSGAMENTGAVVHNMRLQHDERKHLDNTEEDYISHELFHHWFGDLVTCESWANLVLNEGFATYGEYLWREHKYGKDYADELLEQWRIQSWYAHMLGDEKAAVVNYFYRNPVAMFNANSYQKGALILHHLRGYLGDELFFSGMKRYLTQHAYGTAELHDLRMAYEAVSGEDLQWFFDLWYLNPSNFRLQAYAIYVPEEQHLSLSFSLHGDDVTSEEGFKMPLSVWTGNGSKIQKHALMLDREHLNSSGNFEFKIPLEEKPDWWIADGDGHLPALIDITPVRPADSASLLGLSPLFDRLRYAPDAWMRVAAIEQVSIEDFDEADTALLSSFFLTGLKDRNAWVRANALEYSLNVSHNQKAIIDLLLPRVKELAFNDPVRNTRVAAVHWLSRCVEFYKPEASFDPLFIALTQDSSIALSLAGIEAIKDSATAVRYARAGMMNPYPEIALAWTRRLYELLPENSEAPYLKELLRNEFVPKSTRIREMVAYIGYLKSNNRLELIDYFETWLLEDAQKPWRKVAATSIRELKDEMILAGEEDPDAPVQLPRLEALLTKIR